MLELIRGGKTYPNPHKTPCSTSCTSPDTRPVREAKAAQLTPRPSSRRQGPADAGGEATPRPQTRPCTTAGPQRTEGLEVVPARTRPPCL